MKVVIKNTVLKKCRNTLPDDFVIDKRKREI
jgi:hypothetical protein